MVVVEQGQCDDDKQSEETDGPRFWRKFSQTAAEKDLDEKRAADIGDEEDEKQEPLRKVLQKKRSSLSHKPDIVRMFEKESDKAQQTAHVPEFFKVMKELKRVEGQAVDIRAAPQQDEYVMGEGERVAVDTETANSSPEIEDAQKTSLAETKKNATKTKPTKSDKAVSRTDSDVSKRAKTRPMKTQVSDPGLKGAINSKQPKQPIKKSMSVNNTKAKQPVSKTNSLAEKKSPSVAVPTKSKDEATIKKGSLGPSTSAVKSGTNKQLTPGNAKAKSVNKEKKGAGVVGLKKEVPMKQDAKKSSEKTETKAKEASAPRSKAAAMTKPPQKKLEVATNQQPPSDLATKTAKKIPPAVPPKPSSPNKPRVSSSPSDNNSIVTVPPIGHKSSLAERARLVGTLEVPEDRQSTTHFVSSACTTLSPVPSRKVMPAVVDEQTEEKQESGIVETSIKASSVIKQFETRKISKIKPDHEVFLDQPATTVDEEASFKPENEYQEKKPMKKSKKSVDQASSTGKRKVSGAKQAQLFKTTSSASLTNAKPRKTSKDQNKLVKTTSSVSVTNGRNNREAMASPRKSSVERSEPSPIMRTPSNASTSSVKSRENTFVKRSSSIQLLPDAEPDTLDRAVKVCEGDKSDRSIVKTTMVLQLHPAQLLTAATETKNEPIENTVTDEEEVHAFKDKSDTSIINDSNESLNDDTIDAGILSPVESPALTTTAISDDKRILSEEQISETNLIHSGMSSTEDLEIKSRQ